MIVFFVCDFSLVCYMYDLLHCFLFRVNALFSLTHFHQIIPIGCGCVVVYHRELDKHPIRYRRRCRVDNTATSSNKIPFPHDKCKHIWGAVPLYVYFRTERATNTNIAERLCKVSASAVNFKQYRTKSSTRATQKTAIVSDV